jgi:hypothetical protein
MDPIEGSAYGSLAVHDADRSEKTSVTFECISWQDCPAVSIRRLLLLPADRHLPILPDPVERECHPVASASLQLFRRCRRVGGKRHSQSDETADVPVAHRPDSKTRSEPVELPSP